MRSSAQSPLCSAGWSAMPSARSCSARSAYGYGDGIEAFRAAYAEWGAWIILIKGMTPIPFKIVTIASGFAGYNLLAFVVLCFITRGARFFLEAELLRIYGEPIRDFIERQLTLVTTGFLAAIVGGFL